MRKRDAKGWALLGLGLIGTIAAGTPARADELQSKGNGAQEVGVLERSSAV